jgi:hypothetical protein
MKTLYRIWKADGVWMYDTTSLQIAKDHAKVGYTYTDISHTVNPYHKVS